jgi:spore maturation protein CgeB
MLMTALRELGHAVDALRAEVLDERGDRIYFRDPAFRILGKLGLYLDREGVNAAVARAVAEREYDVLWVSKALALRPDVLAQARELQPSLRLVFHSEDDMFARHNQSRWFRRSLPLYDVVFTHKSYNARPDELPSLGARRVVMVDKCFDRNLHRPVRVSAAERAELGAEVGFVGTYERERAESMLALAEAGIRVRVFGGLWESFTSTHPNLRVERRQIHGEDYVRAVAATDVNLGFLRVQNRDLQTDRSIELPACGAFMLAQRTDEHARLFEEGVEAEFFGDTNELIEKVRRYRADPAARRRIGAAGRERCLRDGYSYHDRLEAMLRIVTGDEA